MKLTIAVMYAVLGLAFAGATDRDNTSKKATMSPGPLTTRLKASATLHSSSLPSIMAPPKTSGHAKSSIGAAMPTQSTRSPPKPPFSQSANSTMRTLPAKASTMSGKTGGKTMGTTKKGSVTSAASATKSSVKSAKISIAKSITM